MVILQLSKEELQREIRTAVSEAISDLHSPAKDRLFSREEAAKYLDVSLPTLNTWEKSGQLTPKRFGNRVYFFESELLKRK
jgi:excisionase family DNA binding protein